MKYIVLIAIAICAGTSVHAPELKKSKRARHPLHDASGVTNPFINQTKGDGLRHELKRCKEIIEEKTRTRKRSRWSIWSVLLCTVGVLIGVSIVIFATAALVITITAQAATQAFVPVVQAAGSVMVHVVGKSL